MSGVPRMIRIYRLISHETGLNGHFFISATIIPSGMEKRSVKKKTFSVGSRYFAIIPTQFRISLKCK